MVSGECCLVLGKWYLVVSGARSVVVRGGAWWCVVVSGLWSVVCGSRFVVVSGVVVSGGAWFVVVIGG